CTAMKIDSSSGKAFLIALRNSVHILTDPKPITIDIEIEISKYDVDLVWKDQPNVSSKIARSG
ncbi:MAG TPA: hypothetical protein VE863_11445, partial [Pyrinomonadaceae bacterium]|nr:hypothetical protein [Pyrinomonadaceae bacterium]